MMLFMIVAVLVCLACYIYRSLKPPPPRICDDPHGPPVTSPRIKLSDGRHIAYKESGVNSTNAKYKIIVVHGFGSSKDMDFPISKDLVEELGLYFVFFDRAGYGESDPHPSRTVKSEANDIEELADKLTPGPKVYVIGVSLGAYSVYSCLKYIPHRALRSEKDLTIIKKKQENPNPLMEKARQQGDHESLHRDMIAGFATWEFDPD
ncbi:alpha/beta-Hydrolases superfamily protein [Raphanus sativus]|nr:alpha/beta-Hydrolases superfamily protein [Raphanus sativus]